ncbi:DegT/DnrJ/EryC1/StrS family aminotransferase [Streptomyces sp. NPDC060064]|uniref:DegT/DnrJ/EryC1/StrS family aminotransferase n=1 Tax=Streptomyces sp. NPDC060064 TaxID=3347049 RepID=UPI0036AF4D10
MRKDELALHGGPPAVTVEWSQDWPYIGTEEVAAVTDLLERGVISIYDRSGIVAEFEQAFADYHAEEQGVPYALSHNSGTSSLHAAYFGLGIRPGDEVVVPTYTFLATVTPLLQMGALPVFADLDPVTLTMDPRSVESRISPRTRAIVVTHMWGHPADMAALLAIAERHALPVVEDCSHAHGATIGNRKVGTFGSVGCFSLEGHKAVAAGEGGILVTRSREVYERALMLGHFGRRAKDEVMHKDLVPFIQTGFGHKYRMHPLAAAIALQQLRRLDARNERRRANLDLLCEVLSPVPGIRPPATLPGVARGGWYGFKARYLSAELGGLPLPRFMDALQAEGVQVKRPGSPPLHRVPVFRITRTEAQRLGLSWAGSLPESTPPLWDCPVADGVYPELLSLPTFSGDCFPVVRQYGEAFAKVAGRWQDLL